MSEELKPCPCCNGRAEWCDEYVMCARCELRTPTGARPQITEMWNTRAPIPSPAQEPIKRLNAVLERCKTFCRAESISVQVGLLRDLAGSPPQTTGEGSGKGEAK